jgi:anhydro-N-acetylmuramic acid kinase
MSGHLRHPITRLLTRKRLRVLGVNTGTSIDGLDYALVAIDHTAGSMSFRILATGHRCFPRRLTADLRALAAQTTVEKAHVAHTHTALGIFIGDTINKFRAREGRGCRIDLVGSHGQTIGHFPRARDTRKPNADATWQIGAVNAIAHTTGLVTIGDFRIADTCAGGQGAPLSGYYHHLIFGTPRVVLNLGGIANLSSSRIRNRKLEVRAFDTGPGNMLSDALAQELLDRPFDQLGRAAAQGHPIDRIVSRVLRDPYFGMKPPKTCGREQFGAPFLKRHFHSRRTATSVDDMLASAVEITARSVAAAVQRWIARFTACRSLVLAGGGAKNHTLVRRLTALLPEWQIVNSDALGIGLTALEPVGFAVLARETLYGRPGNLGGATSGAPGVLGTIALPVSQTR